MDTNRTHNAVQHKSFVSLIKGSFVALITPFCQDDPTRIDEKALEFLIDYHIKEGTHGFLIGGTTAEVSALDNDEYRFLVEFCIYCINKRKPVIINVGTQDVRTTIVRLNIAHQFNADGVMIITPYYVRPSQEGLYAYFHHMHTCSSLPIILYNVPSRCGVDLLPTTLGRLLEVCPNIVGIKDATGLMNRVTEQLILANQAHRNESFFQLSGDDSSMLGHYSHGGCGAISVTANLFPKLCASFHNACLKEDFVQGRFLHTRLHTWHRCLFDDTSPSPVKYAMSLLNLCSANVRLPLVLPHLTLQKFIDHKIAQSL